jgi:poly-gamma-glutamate synthesis protein (capsule biosynthesis protein)
LKETGFDILSTANNHCLDGGKNGIISTIENIEDNGLKNIGTYKDDNKVLLIEEVGEIKIGFLSYTLGTNGLDSLLTSDELEYMVDRVDDEKKIKKDIDTLKDAQVDLILAYIHWGTEYQNQPNSYQEKLGKKMVEWGVNIILGSHPHVVQRSEIIQHDGKDNYIIYSMGNFYSNQRYETIGNPYTEDSVMVKFIIEKDLDTNDTIIKDVVYIPTWIYRYQEDNQIKYLIFPIGSSGTVPSELSVELPDKIVERIKKSYEDTMNTIVGNNLLLK